LLVNTTKFILVTCDLLLVNFLEQQKHQSSNLCYAQETLATKLAELAAESN